MQCRLKNEKYLLHFLCIAKLMVHCHYLKMEHTYGAHLKYEGKRKAYIYMSTDQCHWLKEKVSLNSVSDMQCGKNSVELAAVWVAIW